MWLQFVNDPISRSFRYLKSHKKIPSAHPSTTSRSWSYGLQCWSQKKLQGEVIGPSWSGEVAQNISHWSFQYLESWISLNQIHEMNRNFALSTSSALSHVWQPLCGNSMWGCTGWAWWNSVELSVGLECGIPESPLVWWFWCWIYMPSSLHPISKNHEIQLCRLFDSPFKLVFCKSSRAQKLEDASKQAPPALAAPIFCALASSFEQFDAIEISL